MRKFVLLISLVLFASSVGFAQTRAITGQVVDSTNGSPIAGVFVTESGTNNGSMTDTDGRFTVQAAQNATLVFTYMGMTTQQVALAGRTDITVSMVPDASVLEDVVVVGYGVVRKTDMTGAVAVLGDSKLKTATTPRVEDMLNGKVPGVFVGSGSGQPGSTGQIIIRGRTSINGSTAPLWVIDGVIVGSNAGDLNANDIESMTILKDAASTAIYGSQGSNGVIIITTKKGLAGKATVSFSAKAGATTTNMGNLEMMNGSQLYDLFDSFPNKEGLTWFTPELKNRNFDWGDNLRRTGYAQDYSVSVRGGSEKVKIYSSLSYYKENGTVKDFDYQRFSGRLNADWQVYDWLTVKPSVSVSRRDTENRLHSVTAMYQYLPWNSPYNADGSIVGHGSDASTPWIAQSNMNNYLYNLQWNYSQDRAYETSANFDVTARITDWLRFETVNNYRMGQTRGFSYTDPRSLNNSDGGGLYNSSTEWFRYYFNHLLRFNKTFNDDHRVDAIVAYEWNTYDYEGFNTTKYRVVQGADNLDLASVLGPTGGSRNDWAVQSVFLNANYAYQNRFFGQASIRRDGSSKFGVDKRYGTFFSVSGSWNVSEERFFERLRETVNAAKLRLSYGSTGNQPNSLYGSYDTYSLSSAASYGDNNGALMSGTAGNSNMTWETTYTANLGLDVSMWNSRLNLSVDVYDKATSGLLWLTPLPSVWGVSNVWRNVGNVNNKGIEVTLDGDIVRTADWRWNVGVNVGSNKSRIKELYGGLQEVSGGGEMNLAGIAQRIFKVGYGIDTYNIPEWAGVNPEDGTPQWYYNDQEHGHTVTGVYAQARNTPLRGYLPKLYGGFNTALSWKWIDLSAVFSYSYGGKIYNYFRQEYDSDGAYTDRNQMVLHKGWSRWTKPGDVATHPQARYSGNNSSNQTSSRFLEDGSYIKLKNITLGANLPVKSSVISGLRVYVSGENLLTFTKYSGVDPEIPIDQSNVIGTAGPGIYPGVKRIVFGANITF